MFWLLYFEVEKKKDFWERQRGEVVQVCCWEKEKEEVAERERKRKKDDDTQDRERRRRKKGEKINKIG